MFNIKIRVAKEILAQSSEEWFVDEIVELANRFPGLDEMSPLACLPLTQLVANGPSDESSLARLTGIDLPTVERYLEALCDYEFVKGCDIGYEATEMGKNASETIGRAVIIRKRIELQRSQEHIESLWKGIGSPPWP